MERSDAGVRVPASERKRGLGDALAYAVGHRIRLDALAILAEGKHSPNEIAVQLRKNVSTVARHIRELYESGCIEFVGTEQVRGATEHFYRAVVIPEVSDEEYRAMSPPARLEIIGLIVQAIVAETLASLEAGKLETDENLALLWDCVPVDKKGRKEILAEQTASYERINRIKARNVNRLAKARKKAQEEDREPPTGTTLIVTLTAFERSREGRPESGYTPVSETGA